MNFTYRPPTNPVHSNLFDVNLDDELLNDICYKVDDNTKVIWKVSQDKA
jgi:hypothetical protein